MNITTQVRKIINHYEGESPGIKANLYRILMSGKLAGTGKLLILPIDQGFEHGPIKSFASNVAAYDPHYHFNLAIEGGLSGLAAPLGILQAGCDSFAGQIPMILKLNNNNSLVSNTDIPDQAFTSSVQDAVRIGCIGVGITIYPGSDKFLEMLEETQKIIREARNYSLITVIWSYPRGKNLTKICETAIDICSYAAHIAALIGAHIIKVKLPTQNISQIKNQDLLSNKNTKIDTLTERIKHVMQSCFNNKRLVIFSGGQYKSESDLLDEVKSIKDGGGSGSIIGRNAFQRPKFEALTLLSKICNIYRN